MDEKPAGYLQDDNGNNSSMRGMCFLSLLGAFFFGWVAVTKGGENSLIVYFGFLIAAFVPKGLQKFVELMPNWMKK